MGKKIFLVRDRKAFSTKWLCDFATQLSDLGYDVTIVCDQQEYDHKNDVSVADNVKKINLSSASSFLSPFKFKKLVEKEKPDFVFCYFYRDLFNLSLASDKTKLIMMLHNPPVEVIENFNPIKQIIFKKLLKKVSAIQVLMPEFKEQMENIVSGKEIFVIPNQVMEKLEQKDTSIDTKTIIHVAQIAEQNKRQHLLIEAFAKIAHKFPEWKVHFFGQVKRGKHTKYYNKCLARIKELGLENQIFFKGFSKNITNEYLQSEINTLPSRSEGFGYGLADGLAVGLPSVGFADAVGINRIILDGKTGFLVDDVDDYAKKLEILINDKDLRHKMGKEGREDMRQRYSPKVVIDMWQQLLKKIN